MHDDRLCFYAMPIWTLASHQPHIHTENAMHAGQYNSIRFNSVQRALTNNNDIKFGSWNEISEIKFCAQSHSRTQNRVRV